MPLLTIKNPEDLYSIKYNSKGLIVKIKDFTIIPHEGTLLFDNAKSKFDAYQKLKEVIIHGIKNYPTELLPGIFGDRQLLLGLSDAEIFDSFAEEFSLVISPRPDKSAIVVGLEDERGRPVDLRYTNFLMYLYKFLEIKTPRTDAVREENNKTIISIDNYEISLKKGTKYAFI